MVGARYRTTPAQGKSYQDHPLLATLTAHQGEKRTDVDVNASQLEREFGIIFGNQFGVKFGDNDMKILLLLNSNPTFSSQKIADRLDITKRAVEKIIKRLRENSVLERIGSNKSGFWKVNRIGKEGGV